MDHYTRRTAAALDYLRAERLCMIDRVSDLASPEACLLSAIDYLCCSLTHKDHNDGAEAAQFMEYAAAHIKAANAVLGYPANDPEAHDARWQAHQKALDDLQPWRDPEALATWDDCLFFLESMGLKKTGGGLVYPDGSHAACIIDRDGAAFHPTWQPQGQAPYTINRDAERQA